MKVLIIGGKTPLSTACAALFQEKGCEVAESAELGKEAVAEGIAVLGRMDALIVLPPKRETGPMAEVDSGEIDRIFGGYYRDLLFSLQAAARHMRENGIKGSIVVVTDVAGERASADDALFGAAFAAVQRSVQSFALQTAPHGIRINCVALGGIREGEADERMPLLRWGSWHEAAGAIWLPCSPEASYITGAVLTCDGGYSLPGMPETDEGYAWDPTR